MNSTATINPNRRLSTRIMTALGKGREALGKGNIDLADEYLATAEGLALDLAPEWMLMAQPALDGLGDAITAAQIAAHKARQGEGAFSYADA